MGFLNMFNSPANISENVVIGNVYDVCTVCKKKYAKENKKTLDTAEIKLQGSLTGKRIAKIKELYNTIIICPDCLQQIYCDVFDKDDVYNDEALSIISDEEINSVDTDNNVAINNEENTEKKSVKKNAKK